jgi:hypothetical protein
MIYFLQIFFNGNFASTIILPKYGLSESLVEPLLVLLLNNGGEMILSEKVKRNSYEIKKLNEVITDKSYYKDFDFVLSAIPLYSLEKILMLRI